MVFADLEDNLTKSVANSTARYFDTNGVLHRSPIQVFDNELLCLEDLSSDSMSAMVPRGYGLWKLIPFQSEDESRTANRPKGSPVPGTAA